MVKKILNILVRNALEVTNAGDSVSIECKIVRTKIYIQVKDTGPGIEEVEQNLIFEKFYRGKKEGGFGYGLYFAKELSKRHKGDIFVKSKLGEGSCFTLELSFEPSIIL